MSVAITSVDVLVVVGTVVVLSILFPRLFNLPLVGLRMKEEHNE